MNTFKEVINDIQEFAKLFVLPEGKFFNCPSMASLSSMINNRFVPKVLTRLTKAYEHSLT